MTATSLERPSAGTPGRDRPLRGSGTETVAKGFMLLTAGTPMYVWLKWRQSREAVLPVPVASNGAVPAVRKEPRVTAGVH